MTRLAERQRRIALVNRLLARSGVRLSEQGRQLIVQSRTGRTKLVTDLAHVWAAADLLGRAGMDPLDEDFLAGLDGGETHSARRLKRSRSRSSPASSAAGRRRCCAAC